MRRRTYTSSKERPPCHANFLACGLELVNHGFIATKDIMLAWWHLINGVDLSKIGLVVVVRHGEVQRITRRSNEYSRYPAPLKTNKSHRDKIVKMIAVLLYSIPSHRRMNFQP
jgi:hypothetical protein